MLPKSCFNCSTKVDPENRRCDVDGHVFEETLSKLLYCRDGNCPLDFKREVCVKDEENLYCES